MHTYDDPRVVCGHGAGSGGRVEGGKEGTELEE